MGNAIEKKYDVPKEYTATAGHLQLWKIWPGKSKDSTGRLVSIWAFDKGELLNKKKDGMKSALSNLSIDKTVVEQIYQIMKKDMAVTKETNACPSLISSIEIIEDSKNGLAFTTERIVCSLADILNNFEYIPGGYIHHSEFFEGSNTVSEMEISRAMLMMSEGLLFMHNVQKRLHLNITPESIVITATGHWKLCGFGFSLSFQQGDLQRIASPYFLKAINNVNQSQSLIRLEPDLRYSSPEMIEGGYNPPGVRYLAPAHDVFSLALVMYEVYRFNLKMTPNERTSFRSFLTIINNDASQYSAAFDQMRYIDYSFLPLGIDRLISGLLNSNQQQRLTATDITTNPFYVSGNQAIISAVEKLHMKDIGSQTTQLMTLQGQLDTFPPRLLKFTVLPSIGKLCVAVPSLWEYGLPIFQSCAAIFSRDQFQSIAGQYFAAGMGLNTSIETMQSFLHALNFILDSFSVSFFQINATNLFCNALEKQHALLQNLTFEKLWDDNVQSRLEGAQLTEKLIPQLCKEACKNTDSNVKVQSLFIISLFMRKLDKPYIVANIVPSLKYIADNDRTSNVSLHVVGCYEIVSDVLGHEHIASSILPSILPLVIDRTMDKRQFETVVSLVKSMMKKMCEPRTIELRMDPISFGEELDRSLIDPFSGAKAILTNTRNLYRSMSYDSSASTFGEVHGLTRLGGPPPVPCAPPPPPPNLPPPPPPPSQPSPTSDLHNYSASSFDMPPPVPTMPPPPLPVSVPSSPPPVPPPLPPSAPSSSFGYTAPMISPSTSNSAPSIPSVNASVASKIEGFGSTGSSSVSNSTTISASSSKSSFSWFSSSKSSKVTEKEPEYRPPTMTVAAPPVSSSDQHSSIETPLDSSIDLDDFMNSLAQSKKSSNVTTPSTQGILSSGAPPIPPPSSGVPPYSGISLEDQLKQTQEQIAKLSVAIGPGQMGSALPPSQPISASIPHIPYTAPSIPSMTTSSPYSKSTFSSGSQLASGHLGSSSISNGVQQNPPNSTYTGPPNSSIYNSGNTNAMPVYSSGPANSGYGGSLSGFNSGAASGLNNSSTSSGFNNSSTPSAFLGFANGNNYASSSATVGTSNIGNLAKPMGYVPPVIPVATSTSVPLQHNYGNANVGVTNGHGAYPQHPQGSNMPTNSMFMGMNVASNSSYGMQQQAYTNSGPTSMPYGQQYNYQQQPSYGQQAMYNTAVHYQPSNVSNTYPTMQQSGQAQKPTSNNISSAFDFMN